ncbi:TonB family protein [bacterium]|nr:TonB family protein [bacterium]
MICICNPILVTWFRMQAFPIPAQFALRKALPYALSIAFHAALLWQFTSVFAPSDAPLGVWVEMAPGNLSASRPRPVVKSVVDASGVTDSQSASEPAEKQAPAQALGNAAHSAGISGPLGEADGRAATAKERYLYALEMHFNQYKTYPPRARNLGLEGEVGVEFHVYKDGSFKDPHVVRPCIHDMLNRAALQLVAEAPRFQPIPAEVGVEVLHVTVPIHYELH